MRYIIDRLEKELAICENDDKEIIAVSRGELPDTVKEGDVMILHDEDGWEPDPEKPAARWEIDPEETIARRKRIRKKMMDLFE